VKNYSITRKPSSVKTNGLKTLDYLVFLGNAISEHSGILIALVGIVSLLWAVRTLHVNTALTARNKRAEVRIHCIRRYEELSDFRQTLDSNILIENTNTQSYFRRHWAIKREQFDFWIDGLVAPRDIVSWFMSDIDHFSDEAGGRFDQKVYLDGWNHVKSTLGFVDGMFKGFVEELITIAKLIDDRDVKRKKLIELLHKTETEIAISEIEINQGKQGRIRIMHAMSGGAN